VEVLINLIKENETELRDSYVGDSDWWCSDICSMEAKHTDTIFYVVRQIAYIHGRGSFY
jgi:hypothetical protein